MSSSLLAAVVLAVAPPAEPAPLPTAAELAAGLARVRTALGDVYVIAQNRWEQSSAPSKPLGPPVGQWIEAFLKDDAAQIRLHEELTPPGAVDWWPTGQAAGVPLTGETADAHGGRLIALRAPGDGPVRSQLMGGFTPDPRRALFSSQLYTTSADFERLSLPAPQAFAGRPWSVSVTTPGLMDQFAETNLADWVVEGRETKDGRAAVRVLVVVDGPSPYPTQTDEGVLDLSACLRAWFTDDDRHDLFRVENVQRWRYDGREIPVVDAAGKPSPPHRVATADDFRTVSTAAGAVRVPFAGRDVYYSPVPPAEGEEAPTWAGPDSLIEEFLRTGRIADEGLWFVSLSQEWRIETLEPLAPGVAAADLWIEPSYGIQWHDAPTGRDRIVGLTDVESWLIFTFRNRYAAWWAFGPPLALCAMIVAAWWWRRRQRRWATA